MTKIRNQADLAKMLCADNTKASIERSVYKYTDCGAWIELNPEGIRIGSIVEGCDNGTSTFALDYPFTEEEYRAAEAAIEKEATAIWEWANVTYDRLGRKHRNGKTPAEMGIDFPNIWVEHQNLKGFSS